MTQDKRKKGWRMSCDVDEMTESLENELCSSLHLRHSSFSNPSVVLPTSQLILQSFRCFIYVTVHSPTLPLLHLRHSSFSNPYFASPTSQDFRLRHLANRPWDLPKFVVSTMSGPPPETTQDGTQTSSPG